jgi:hypothetical protein
MTKLNLFTRVFGSALLLASAVSPALALDYEAKPVNWVLQSPFRLIGGLAGGVVTGGVSAPIDHGYHWMLKGTTHVAGKFGDEKGLSQVVAAVPIGGSVGLVLGTAYGVPDGFLHGFKKGWEKPFSRWSFITMEEK